jgi:Cu/Ag efflux pump CusA
VRLRGSDPAALEEAAELVRARVAKVPGTVGVHAQGVRAAPGVRIVPRRADMLRLGVPATAIEQAVRATLGGLPVGRVVEGERQADIVVRVSDEASSDPARLARLPLLRSGGDVLPLATVADVALAPLRTSVTHEDGVRTAVVRLDAQGRSLEAVARDVEAVVGTLALPPGVYAEVGGEYAAARAARQRLLGLGALALVGMFVLLLLDFGSLRLAVLALVNVPLAFVGGLAAVLLGLQGQLSLGAIVGFITVFGVAMRNGILLLAHFRHLEAEGGVLDASRLAVAAGDRLSPILMTALVTGIALLPLIALGGRAGGEIEHPMAVVIVGGLFSSSLMNLFVVPVLYARMRRA